MGRTKKQKGSRLSHRHRASKIWSDRDPHFRRPSLAYFQQLAVMPDPATLAISGISAAVNTTVTLVKFIHELKSTPTDVKTCLDLVSRVDEDIQYAIKLRQKHLKHLTSTPDELKRLDRIIAGANQSILDVGRLLEGCRREAHGGQVPMVGRLKWVMGDSTAFSRRTANLQQQHAAINVEIGFLRNLEALQPVKDLLISNTTFENPELLSMGRRKSSSRLSNFYDIGRRLVSSLPQSFILSKRLGNL